ncbi:hypothetical protein SOPP22_15915 [Shewanella sp. OPT22]|nr:hypothetical protein SOPP22_15915 [Shewanella sp. OPT22]
MNNMDNSKVLNGQEYIEQVKKDELWLKASDKLPFSHKLFFCLAFVLTVLSLILGFELSSLGFLYFGCVCVALSHMHQRLDAIEKIAKDTHNKAVNKD